MCTLDIIIPQYRDTQLLSRCLNSLATINLPSELTTIWVVENGGEYGAKAIVDEMSSTLPISYLYQEVGNLSQARNLAAKHSTSDFVVFFDNDMTFDEHTIDSYVNAFKKYGDDAFYGGSLEPDYEVTPAAWLVEFLPNSAKGFELDKTQERFDKPHFLGGNHAVYRQDLLALGGYDLHSADGDNKGAVGEENRLQQKLLDKGKHGVYVHGARVKHFVPKDNCSKSWTLKRAYRQGFTLALEQHDEILGRRLFGIPLFQIKEYFRRSSRYVISRITLAEEKNLFKAQYDLSFQQGVLSGYREIHTSH